MIEWLTSGLEAYKHKDEIKNLLTAGWGYIFTKPTSIAVTGMAGAGKTVLFDFLSGKGFEAGYKPPGQSEAKEAAKMKASGKRYRVTTVPGQQSQPREETLDDLFKGKDPVDGVLHVVANGFATKRTAAAKEQMKGFGIKTLKDYRDQLLREELADLASTCAAIRESHKRHHKPSWMIVVADKIDLYHDEANAARDYYAPGANNPFGNQIRDLIADVGKLFLRWDDTLPLCTYIEKFEWEGEKRENQLDPSDRNAYFMQFLERLKNYCK